MVVGWCNYDYYDDCSSSWYSWGRWLLLGLAVAAAIVAIIGVRWYSMFQVRHGNTAVRGTTWMLPPSYHQSQQQAYGGTAAPPYNPAMGDEDAGYYDHHGNFVAKPPNDIESAYRPPADGPHYGPPSDPPPAQSAQTGLHPPDPDEYGPPPGPPPANIVGEATPGIAASDYYPPPAAARKH